jgi:hypothetical protein
MRQVFFYCGNYKKVPLKNSWGRVGAIGIGCAFLQCMGTGRVEISLDL